MARGYRTPRPAGKFTDLGILKKAEGHWIKGLLLAFPEANRDLPPELTSVYSFDHWLGTPWLEYNDAWYGSVIPDLAIRARKPHGNPQDNMQNHVVLAKEAAEDVDREEGGKPYYEEMLRFKFSRENFPVLYVSMNFKALERFLLDVRASNVKHPESMIEVVQNPFILSPFQEPPKPSDRAPHSYVRLWWD
ncbi:MAG: hypothetical protein PHC52_00500 [Syntrophales bacterium]|nr:hypothetical protein [Syntrophales bacterium]